MLSDLFQKRREAYLCVGIANRSCGRLFHFDDKGRISFRHWRWKEGPWKGLGRNWQWLPISRSKFTCVLLVVCKADALTSQNPTLTSGQLRRPPSSMSLSFKGHTVVITGAGGGLGKSFVRVSSYSAPFTYRRVDIRFSLLLVVLMLSSTTSTRRRLRRSLTRLSRVSCGFTRAESLDLICRTSWREGRDK